MDIKKLLTGTIVGGLVFFLLGWLVYGFLLKHYMLHNPGIIGRRVYMSDPVMRYIIIGSLLQGATLAWIFIKGNVKSLVDGLTTGAVIGFLICAFVDSYMYGSTYMLSKRAIVADVLASAVISAVAGAALAMVFGSNKKEG
jgi:predicted membrane protein